jgi:hypothetical protein
VPTRQVGRAGAIGKAIGLVEASGGDTRLAAAILDVIDAGPAGAPRGDDGSSSKGAAGGAGGMDEGAREELRFRLHMALGRLSEAGRSALEIARVGQVGAEDGWVCSWDISLCAHVVVRRRGAAPHHRRSL